jgi:hypothetical protein
MKFQFFIIFSVLVHDTFTSLSMPVSTTCPEVSKIQTHPHNCCEYPSIKRDSLVGKTCVHNIRQNLANITVADCVAMELEYYDREKFNIKKLSTALLDSISNDDRPKWEKIVEIVLKVAVGEYDKLKKDGHNTNFSTYVMVVNFRLFYNKCPTKIKSSECEEIAKILEHIATCEFNEAIRILEHFQNFDLY